MLAPSMTKKTEYDPHCPACRLQEPVERDSQIRKTRSTKYRCNDCSVTFAVLLNPRSEGDSE